MHLPTSSAETPSRALVAGRLSTGGERFRQPAAPGPVDTAPEPGLDAIVRLAAARYDCPRAALLLVDGQRLRCKARVGDLPTSFDAPAAGDRPTASARGAGRDGDAWIPDDAVVIADTLAAHGLGDAAARLLRTVAPTHARFVAATPVVVDGRRVGLLCCLDTQPRAIDAGALAALRDLAIAAGALLAGRLPATRIRPAEDDRPSAAGRPADLRTILERAVEAEGAIPMAVLDAGSQALAVTLVNRAFEQLSGWTRGELIGRDLRTLQGDLMRQPGIAALGRAVARGRPCTVQITSPRRDGSRFTNELHIAPVRNAQGRLTHFVCLMNDVTARAVTIDKLRVSEELYRSVAATMSDGMLVVMPDGRIVAANAAAAVIFGVAVETLIGHGAPWPFDLRGAALEAIPEAEHPLRLALDRRVDTDGQPFGVQRQDGSVRWIEFNCHPLRIGADTARLPVLATFRDITEQRLAEQSLATSEERWKFALDGAGQGVWDWNVRDGGFYMTDALKALLGFETQELGSTYDEWLARVHHDDLPGVRQRLHAHLRFETPQFQAEHRMRHRDGQWRWVVNRARVVRRNAEGRAERMVGTLADITARRESETALRDKQAAELANRAKTEFLARMSHEMRTPLNAVIGFSQLLLNRPGTPDGRQVQDYVQHVLRAGEHLLALINDVLDLQRVEEGRIVLDRRDVSPHAVATRVGDLLAATATSLGVTFVNDIAPDLLVRADERLLRQVLLNVASNAVKYNRRGGTVRWSAQIVPGRRLAVHVDDMGQGLTTAQLARLFEPFERLGQESGAVEGSGLGLIIARRFCTAMGASLDVTSRPGEGSRASVVLPLGLPTATRPAPVPAVVAAPRPAPAPPAKPAPGNTAPLRMLYVEDNRINAILFQAAFGDQTGFDLRLAENGEEALESVDDWQPDVLVLDAHLPGINGFDLLQRLRRRPGLADVPAYMCSADAMPEDIRRATEAGFNGYWPKPINFARIIDDLGKLGPLSTRFQARP